MSSEEAEQVFENGRVCVCIKDADHRVVEQNESCKKLCGDLTGAVCDKNCMCYYRLNKEHPERSEGMQFYGNKTIEGEQYDICLVNDGERLTTLLYPLESKTQAAADALKEYHLTAREQQIALLIVQGRTNAEIAAELFINKSTVKSHINNMNRKIPCSVRETLGLDAIWK